MTLRTDLIKLAQNLLSERERRKALGGSQGSSGSVAERMAAWVTQIRLDDPYGGSASRQGRSWDIGFSKPGHVSGVIKVFGPRFVQIKFQTQIQGLPTQESKVFLSEWDAKQFLKLAFVDQKIDQALAIPTKGV
jgi:hypothetical protein